MVSWQAFPSSRAPGVSLAPKTPFPFPFKRLPRRLRNRNSKRPFSKVLELLVYNQLYSFIKKHHTSLDLGKDIPLNKLFLK